MEIYVKEKTIVRPARETPRDYLWNSNLDLLVPPVHIPTVYFYRRPNDCSAFFDALVLKQALSNALVLFYPLAGRLARDENGRLEIECNAEGALFIQAETSCVIDDEFGCNDFTPSLKMRQLIPTVDYSAQIFSYPLLVIQVTHFKCEGVCLGVLLHHTLADGTSAVHFINTWANMARGLFTGIPPFIDRTTLRLGVPPSPTFHHIEYDPPPSMNTPTQIKDLQSSPKPTSTAIIKLSLEQVNGLKAKSKKDLEPSIKCSTYAILAAHIWRCMCKARGLSDDQASKLYVATDGRSRLNPPLPRGYFGNVLFTATAISKSGDIQSEPLIQTINRIHTALKRMDDEYLKSALAFLDQQYDLTPLMRGAPTFKCPNLNVVSWITLPIHDADFAWGRPVFMGPASVIFEGMVYILPSPGNDGSLSLAICLEKDHMELFKKYIYDY